MKTTIQHPSAFIEAEDVNIFRNNALEAEQLGMLHPEQLKVIYKQMWFKLLIPEVYTGCQLSLPSLLQQQEAISWADGSTGWVVTLCNGAGWFSGFISPEISNEIFGTENVCLAGSGAAGGTAEITQSGYLINGSWKYASGVHHATHITANCIIKKDGEQVLTDDGQALILPFIFDKKDVQILTAWKYIGMMATGSDSFEVNNLEVSPNRQFKIDAAATVVNAPLYLYPFLQLAEATIAVNLSGIAIHFMDLCEDIFHEKLKQPWLTDEQKVFFMDELNKAQNEINIQRIDFYEVIDQSWDIIQNANTIPETILSKVSIASRRLAHISSKCVDRLYPLCGLTAARTETDINRAWRDLHTASQHMLLSFPADVS
jgi:hypothetical protein